MIKKLKNTFKKTILSFFGREPTTEEVRYLCSTPKIGKRKFSNIKFVEACRAANRDGLTCKDLAEGLGLSKKHVKERMRDLRKAGVRIPLMVGEQRPRPCGPMYKQLELIWHILGETLPQVLRTEILEALDDMGEVEKETFDRLIREIQEYNGTVDVESEMPGGQVIWQSNEEEKNEEAENNE